MLQPTDRWELVNYFDVWGNAEDGWEVNDLCVEFDDLHIEDDATDEDLIEYLKSIKFLSTNANTNSINVINYGDIIEFESAGNNCPLCRLERVYE